nr:unnamed protein product [Haemonchus contortus]
MRKSICINSVVGEGTRRVRGEDEVIRENEGSIELMKTESEHDEHEREDQDLVNEDMGSDSAHDDLSEVGGSEEELEELGQEEPEEPEQGEPEDLEQEERKLEGEDDIPDDIPRRENVRRRAIQIEH